MFPNDTVGADAAKERGIDRAERGAGEAWMTAALAAVRRLARERVTFTTDDVWQLVGQPPEPRAMGAAMRAAGKLKLAEPTGNFEMSRRAACHRRPLRVWRSTAL